MSAGNDATGPDGSVGHHGDQQKQGNNALYIIAGRTTAAGAARRRGQVVTGARVMSRADPAVARRDRTRAGAARHQDGYEDLAPSLAEFAATTTSDPRRRVLHDELVAAFWPAVMNIARHSANTPASSANLLNLER